MLLSNYRTSRALAADYEPEPAAASETIGQEVRRGREGMLLGMSERAGGKIGNEQMGALLMR